MVGLHSRRMTRRFNEFINLGPHSMIFLKAFMRSVVEMLPYWVVFLIICTASSVIGQEWLTPVVAAVGTYLAIGAMVVRVNGRPRIAGQAQRPQSSWRHAGRNLLTVAKWPAEIFRSGS